MKTRDLSFVLPVLLLSACATAPSAVNDYTGLGNHQVAQTLRSALFLGESAVNRSLGKLVNTRDILAQDDPRPGLRGMGFDCDLLPAASCTYEGSATSELSSPDRASTLRLKTFVHVEVMLDSKPFKLVSRIRRESF